MKKSPLSCQYRFIQIAKISRTVVIAMRAPKTSMDDFESKLLLTCGVFKARENCTCLLNKDLMWWFISLPCKIVRIPGRKNSLSNAQHDVWAYGPLVHKD